MRKRSTRLGALLLSAAMVLSLVNVGDITAYAAESEGTNESSTAGLTEVTDAEMDALTSDGTTATTSVHDPSIVSDGNGSYYIFGSHMGVSKTTDLINWTGVTSETLDSTLFGKLDEDGNVAVCPYTEAYNQNAYTGKVTTKIKDEEGNYQTVEVDFGDSYNADTWNAEATIAGNQWAPDVIYNTAMNKWCMYMSVNGDDWHSSIVLLTADQITGPYVYQGPVVFSGFDNDSTSDNYYKNTDYEIVYGQQDSLASKYDTSSWGTYFPNAIDPCVFYDEDGKLWMSYGSWSGGIFMLELDENTGLRDYTVTYESDYASKGASYTADEYFGTRIAGGYYVSGEGSYIRHIGDYYYLFISYGFYSPTGGYNMRVFRSKTVDGGYVDANGESAIYSKYVINYNGDDQRGVMLMNGYKWDTMDKGEVAQGHNSVLVDSDGRIYLVYHTKYDDESVSHNIRVHQLYMNEDGWLVAAPYEYAGETISSTGYASSEEAGDYDLIIHNFSLDYAHLATATSEDITLNADGTITSDTHTGTWKISKENTPYVTITLDNVTYKGVFSKQTVTGSSVSVMCFSAMSEDGTVIWGSGQPTSVGYIAQTITDTLEAIPSSTYSDITLPVEGVNSTVISWASSDESVITSAGKVTTPAQDTKVTLTATLINGNYYYIKKYDVTVYATAQNSTDSVVVGKYFQDSSIKLADYAGVGYKVDNPFYYGTTNGLDLSGGVTIEFDAKSTGAANALAAIFAFNDANSGKFYFTSGSYLGYNANDFWFDANLKSYAIVKDYIGDEAHVAITVTSTGFTVKVNDEVAYTEAIREDETIADGTLTKYTSILDWLYNDANSLIFGSGDWWSDQVANVELSNVVCSVNPVDASVDLTDIDVKESTTDDTTSSTYDIVSYTKDSVEITSNDYYEEEDNPFYGKNIDNLTVEYTINMSESAAKNGWDGIFSFFNSSTSGRVSFQTSPYICYNDWAGNWMDINRPDQTDVTNVAPTMEAGKDYTVKLVITEDEIIATVDGEKISLSSAGSGATYSDMLSFITKCDKLTMGVGLAKSAYWNTELCTLKDINIYSSVAQLTKKEVTIDTNSYIDKVDSPFKGVTANELDIEYTINMSESAAKNGWDGIFSFYNSSTGGRVSIQTSPYVCYNDASGNWMDINRPDQSGVTNVATTMEAGKDYTVKLVITADGIKATVDGEEISLSSAGSGANYEDMLAFISTCDQFTWGVGLAETAYWNTELCTLKDVSIVCKDGTTTEAFKYVEESTEDDATGDDDSEKDDATSDDDSKKDDATSDDDSKKDDATSDDQTTDDQTSDVDETTDDNDADAETPKKAEHTHKGTKVEAKAATCTAEGNSEYYVCDCGKYFSDEACTKEIAKDSWVIAKTAHKEKAAVKENEVAATYTTEGSYDEVVYCETCGAEISRTTKTVEKLTLSKVSLKSVKSSKKKKLTIKWAKNSKATGYQIQYSTSKSFKSKTTTTKTVKSAKTTSKTYSKLKSKKKYYVRIRAYVVENGKKAYSSWSSVKTVKIK